MISTFILKFKRKLMGDMTHYRSLYRKIQRHSIAEMSTFQFEMCHFHEPSEMDKIDQDSNESYVRFGFEF